MGPSASRSPRSARRRGTSPPAPPRPEDRLATMNRDDLTDLRRNTVIWIAVVLWLGVSYLLAITPAGPYADALRTAFTAFLAVGVPLVSLLIAAPRVLALRGPGRPQERGSTTAPRAS